MGKFRPFLKPQAILKGKNGSRQKYRKNFCINSWRTSTSREKIEAEISALKTIEDIPDSQLLLFKSCMVEQEYPGVETSTCYVFDRLGIDTV